MAEFRANYSKLALKLVKRIPERESLITAIGGETVEAVARAGLLEWLPAERHMKITNAIPQILGTTGAQSFWRDLMLHSFQGRLLKPLVEGGLRLFGPRPRSILRLSSQAYSLIARGCGEISVTEEAGALRLDFIGLPPVLRMPGFVALCHGNCMAVLAFLGHAGKVDSPTSGFGSGSFAIHVR